MKTIRSTFSVFLLLFLITITLSSCWMIQKQQLMKTKYPYYPQYIRHAIDNNFIVEGMNKEQVALAIGPTSCITTAYYKGKNTEAWHYQRDGFTGKALSGTFDCYRTTIHVYFEYGKVIGWENL